MVMNRIALSKDTDKEQQYYSQYWSVIWQ